MMGFIDALVRGLRGLLAALHPGHVRRFLRVTPIYAPLAVRSVRRRILRHLLVGLALGAGMVVFLGLASSFGGAAVGTAGRTRDLVLPADAVVIGTLSSTARPVADLQWVVEVNGFEAFDRRRVASSVGTRWVVGLDRGGLLWRGLGLGDAVGLGEVALPRGLAASGQLGVGDVLRLGTMEPTGFQGRECRVAALFDCASSDALLGEAIVVSLEESSASGVPNSVAVWQREGTETGRLLRRLTGLFPGAVVWWPGFPAAQSYRFVGGFLSPGNLILALTFVLAGLGVFNVMLLSLLQRKVQLGILKALGAVNDEVFLLLLLEGSFMAAGGTVLGLLGGYGLVRLLDRASQVPLHLATAHIVWAIVLAVTSFLLAAWLPSTLCRRASPVQLMSGRRLYLNPRSTCAQCGRCGGF